MATGADGATDEEALIAVGTLILSVAVATVLDGAGVATGGPGGVETEASIASVAGVGSSAAADAAVDVAAEALGQVGRQGEAGVAALADVVELADRALGDVAGHAGTRVADGESLVAGAADILG